MMLASTLREPPIKGSLRESVLMLYYMKREQMEYYKSLAFAQLTVDKEKGLKIFNEDYLKLVFPWTETATRREGEAYREALQKAVKSGPLSIKPIGSLKQVRSRMVKKIEPKKEVPSEELMKKRNEIYRKLDRNR